MEKKSKEMMSSMYLVTGCKKLKGRFCVEMKVMRVSFESGRQLISFVNRISIILFRFTIQFFFMSSSQRLPPSFSLSFSFKRNIARHGFSIISCFRIFASYKRHALILHLFSYLLSSFNILTSHLISSTI